MKLRTLQQTEEQSTADVKKDNCGNIKTPTCDNQEYTLTYQDYRTHQDLYRSFIHLWEDTSSTM